MTSILKIDETGDGMPATGGGPEWRHLPIQRKRTASTDTLGTVGPIMSPLAIAGIAMCREDDPPITEILARGDAAAMDALIPKIYATLHQLARRQRAHEASHTLETTALVHEAYLKLAGQDTVAFADREHLYAYMSRVMRHLLIDRARRKKAQKRQAPEITAAVVQSEIVDVLALDEALTRLAALDERLARVAELRLFAELSSPDIAEVIGVTARTVERDWLKARTFLSACLIPDA
jgi:RNA polymerase sigma factor (TIGR02999 family)